MTETEIYNISWVTPENFDPDKVSVVDNNGRSKVMYDYGDKTKDLVVTVPLDEKAFMICRGVQKNVFTQGDKKVETNRYVAPLILEGNNPYHIKLYHIFEQINKIIVKKTGAKNVIFPIKDVQGKYSIVYANLIHENEGRMFSTAYTAEEQINIIDCKKAYVRPAILLSAIRRSPTEYKIQMQISQMYVAKEIKDFPLAVRDF